MEEERAIQREGRFTVLYRPHLFDRPPPAFSLFRSAVEVLWFLPWIRNQSRIFSLWVIPDPDSDQVKRGIVIPLLSRDPCHLHTRTNIVCNEICQLSHCNVNTINRRTGLGCLHLLCLKLFWLFGRTLAVKWNPTSDRCDLQGNPAPSSLAITPIYNR